MTKFNVNSARLPRLPRLPWAHYPRWRPTWPVPEVERLALYVERLWCREPLDLPAARRIEAVAHVVERWRIRVCSDAALRHDQLAWAERALGQVERTLDAAARTAANGGSDGDLI